MQFNNYLSAALAGRDVFRPGWRNKFHLVSERDAYTVPVLLRVADDGSFRAPWGAVTEDDSVASDYLFADGELLSPVGDDAVTILSGGGKITQTAWPKGMHVYSATAAFGRHMVLVLPNGAEKLFRPAPQDLTAEWTTVG